MPRDHVGTVEDDELVVAGEDLNRTPHEAMRHAVAHGVHVDETVGRDPARLAPLTHIDLGWW
jgi:hypothetical protein